MAGALGLVLTSDVPIAGQHAQPIYVDNSLPIVGPSRACVLVSNNEIPPMGGPPIAARLAPPGTPAVGPAIPVYVVPGGGILDTFAYTNKSKALSPILLLPMADASGTTATDESGNGRNGTYSGVTLGVAGIGDGRTAVSLPGAGAFINIFSTSFQTAFNPREFTIAGWLNPTNAAWTDGTVRALCRIRKSGAADRIDLYKDTTNRTITFVYVANGVTKSVAHTFGVTPSGYVHVAVRITQSGDQAQLFISGAQSGTTQTALGAWAVTTLDNTQCTVGALSTAPVNVTDGSIAQFGVYPVLSAAQIASLAVVP